MLPIPTNNGSQPDEHWQCARLPTRQNGKHGWVGSLTSITAASNIIVQPFSSISQRRFSVNHSTFKSSLSIPRFAILSQIFFLCSLTSTPKSTYLGTSSFIEVSDHDYRTYMELRSFEQNIGLAIKTFNGRKSVVSASAPLGGWKIWKEELRFSFY